MRWRSHHSAPKAIKAFNEHVSLVFSCFNLPFVINFTFVVHFSEEKGIPVDTGSGPASSAQSSTTSNLLQGSAGTTATTARQNSVNPLNNQPYSQRYYTLYRKRITLPVFEYRADFMRLLAENQCIVLVGEVSLS